MVKVKAKTRANLSEKKPPLRFSSWNKSPRGANLERAEAAGLATYWRTHCMTK